MTDPAWQSCPPALAEDRALSRAILDAHQAILRDQLVGDPMLNRTLGMELRALRRIEGWRVLLLLTPWMLARLLFPDESPIIEIPPDWTAERRRDADYLMLGPSLEFELFGQPQKAHLNFHPSLGHYLLQPLCLDMAPYADAAAVFEAWDQVIRIRDENMEKARRECPMQREVSRRELFRRMRLTADD